MDALLDKTKISSLISSVTTEKPHTYEVQLTIKNYDFKKDIRFDSNCVLPHEKRKIEKILILADKQLEAECVRLNIPAYSPTESISYVTYEDITGTNKDRKKFKKKLAQTHHSLVALPTFNKAFEMRIVASKGIPIFTIKTPGELSGLLNDLKKTVKFKLKKCHNMFFPVGHMDMTADEVTENVVTGLSALVGLLKKGMQNVQSVHLKSTRSKAVRLY